MSAQHTPGPWKWWDKSTGRPERYDLCKLIAANGKRIFGGYGGEGFSAIGKTPEDEANARLIVAAPDLLEALEDAVACGLIPITSASEGGAARFSEQVKAADKVRAAIAKAKGESVSLVTSEAKSESERSEA